MPQIPVLGIDSDTAAPTEATLRAFDDAPGLRTNISEGVLAGLTEKFPVENDRYRLELGGLKFEQQKFKLAEQKRAILEGRTLSSPVKGTWRLFDKETNQELDKTSGIVLRIPHVNRQGTYIYNGNQYTVSNQARLRPGIYTRRRESGEIESHFNVKPGTGIGFRVMMEPKTGIFKLNVGQANLKLLPVLRGMGLNDSDVRRAWGNELFEANAQKDDPSAFKKAAQRLVSARARESVGEGAESLALALAQAQLDPEVNKRTLGQPYDKVELSAIVDATRKMIAVSRGEQDTDDRDSMEFQEVRDASDLFKERITRDAGMAIRKLLWKITNKGNLSPVRAGILDDQMEGALYASGLGTPLEEINPLEILDKTLRITKMGEGGVSSLDSVPDSSREVQPSQFGVVDPIQTAESSKVGIDLRTAIGTYKGSDGQIYSQMMNARTGEEKPVSARNLAQSVIAFPGELTKKGDAKVRAMVRGKLGLVSRDEVDYELPHASEMFGAASNLVPLISAIKGQRLSMGARMITQALALKDGESPYVQSEDRYGVSFEERYGKQAGAVRSDRNARVTEVVPGSHITLRGADGVEEQIEMFDNFPYNRKSFLNNTPMVAPGDMVKPGQLLAKSNFTDDKGTLALGKNFRVGYLPFKTNFEDAIVISESAAKRLTSEHMYPNELEIDDKVKTGKEEYTSNFPTVYSREQLSNIDRDGVVKPGTKVQKGDPLALAFGFRDPKPGEKLFRRKTSDKTMTWDHMHEGEVTDVVKSKDGHRVFVKAYAPMEVGDKLSGRHGDKGIISQIVPDGEMPEDSEGRPIEIALNPLGIITRVNPAQIFEAALGKIAEKRGKPYVLPSFKDGSLVDFVQEELKKYGVKDTEDLIDPKTGRKLKDVFTGSRFMMKLHHTAESKESGRETGSYTMDMAPAKGKIGQAKRLGGMELTALASHGASEVIRDSKLIRGQRNDEFWQAFRLGYAPAMPKIPHAYEKFVATLQAAGVNVQKKGNTTNIMALTNADVDKLSGGAIQNPGTINFETMEPVPGGLFDRKLFGGHNGRSWAHIPLAEPMPNPVMEDPIRRLLGLTKKQFRAVMTGEEQLNGKVGGAAVFDALKSINVDEAIKTQRSVFQSGRKSYRDDAAKRLGYLKNFKAQGLHPSDLMLTKAPVLPTLFRPVSKFRRMQIMADANLLYKDLFEANEAYTDLVKEVGTENAGEERLAIYDAFKAVSGLGDPIKAETEQKQAKGLLKQVFGSSPKYGYYQRRVMASPMDMVGRAVVTPDAGMDMDQVGIPEDKAWELYKPFTIRRLVRAGFPPTQAVRMVADQDDRAKRVMQEEMSSRPVLVNRNPTLHKYGIMAAFPVMVKGKTLRVSPTTVGGYGMDFDGDTAQYHVPVSETARKEAIEKMLPSKNLLSQQDFDVHYVPTNEFALGLYLASALKAKRQRTFADKESVINAFKRGEIDAGTVVSIPERGDQ